MNNEPTSNRLIIIHDTDADGTAAAWCIKHHLADQYSDLLLIPQRAGVNTIPEGLTNNDSVFLVDRTYPWEMLLDLHVMVYSITVIDHHKSAMKDYYTEIVASGLYDLEEAVVTDSSLYIRYNIINIHMCTNHSACMLAWNYGVNYAVNPDPDNIIAPWFISYIEDRDLWAWKLPNSKEINAGLHYVGHTFENYDYWLENLTQYSFHNIGVIVTNVQLNIIKSIAHGPTVGFKQLSFKGVPPYTPLIPYSNTTMDGMVGLNFAILCCPFTLISDLGDYMLNCTDEGFNTPDVVLCYNEVDDGFTYSIRSKHDMIWLAKMFGGGGHPNACGFTTVVPPNSLLEVVKFRLANPTVAVDWGVDEQLVVVNEATNTAVSDMKYDTAEVENTINPDVTQRAFSDLPI